MKFLQILSVYLCLALLGCSTIRTQTGRLIKKDSVKAQQLNLPVIDFTSSSHIRKKFTREFLSTPKGADELGQLVNHFIVVSNGLKNGHIVVPPRSTLKIRLNSFCTNSTRASPDENEVYTLSKGYPSTPYIKNIMQAIHHTDEFDGFKQGDLQELIWNLANKTSFDDLPVKHQAVLARVAPSSQLSMRLRGVKNQIKRRLLPDEVNSVMGLVEGRYYEFKDFRSRMEKLVSAYVLSDKFVASEVPETRLLAQTRGVYYEQTLSLSNPTDDYEQFDLSQYYLKPLRSDVQPLILASTSPDLYSIEKTLREKTKSAIDLIRDFLKLKAKEKVFVVLNPEKSYHARDLSKIAIQAAADRYPAEELKDGRGDAFRHFVFAAMLTRDLGSEDARIILKNHEPPGFSNPTEMDHFNNRQGVLAAQKMKRATGKRYIPNRVFFKLAERKIRSNELMVIKKYKNKK